MTIRLLHLRLRSNLGFSFVSLDSHLLEAIPATTTRVIIKLVVVIEPLVEGLQEDFHKHPQAISHVHPHPQIHDQTNN